MDSFVPSFHHPIDDFDSISSYQDYLLTQFQSNVTPRRKNDSAPSIKFKQPTFSSSFSSSSVSSSVSSSSFPSPSSSTGRSQTPGRFTLPHRRTEIASHKEDAPLQRHRSMPTLLKQTSTQQQQKQQQKQHQQKQQKQQQQQQQPSSSSSFRSTFPAQSRCSPSSSSTSNKSPSPASRSSSSRAMWSPLTPEEERRYMAAVLDSSPRSRRRNSGYSAEPSSKSSVVARGFNMDIQKSDISRMRDGAWLNDEVINFYLLLVNEKLASQRVHVFNSFFYSLLQKHGYERVARWTRSIDLFSCSRVILPVHLGSHWCLAVVDMARKELRYYDSLRGSGERCLRLLAGYLVEEMRAKQGKTLDLSKWSKITVKDLPRQSNGYDCGVFACQYGRCIIADKPFDFTQKDMPFLRKRMTIDILDYSSRKIKD